MSSEWLDETNINFLRESRAAGREPAWMAQQLGVTRNAVAGALHRLKLNRASYEVPPVKLIKDFWTESHVPVWASEEADTLFRRLWDGGVPTRLIRVFWNLSEDQMRRRKRKIGLSNRDPSVSTIRRFQAATLVPSLTKKKPTPAVPIEAPKVSRPLAYVGGRPGSSITFGAINWGVVNAIKISRTAGICQWPLSCGEPTTKAFCARHAGLIGKKAA